MDVRDREPAVAPPVAAGLLLAARSLGATLGLSMPSGVAIVEATGASRSRGYEMRDEVLGLLGSLTRPPGRPAASPPSPAPEVAYRLRGEVLEFIKSHPGCVHGGPERRRYSGAYRRFALELRARNAELDLCSFAEAVTIPLGTLEDWLRPGRDANKGAGDAESGAATERLGSLDPMLPKIEMLLDAWRQWQGGAFRPFCEHVRDHLHLNFGDTMIRTLLFEHGVRGPKRRPGRTPDEEALRGAFETFFPGAQWVGDGTEIEVVVDEQEHRFNLELMIDAHTSAWVGIKITDAEDSDAVIGAFEHGVRTTGSSPIALLLDNKCCNHTEQVDEAIGETARIRSTTERPQNKAHCEGAFGLFRQKVPSIEVHTDNPRRLARQVLWTVVETFARTLNHKPRLDRNGYSRVDLYHEPVSDEQIEHAKERLKARLRKQERARQTRAARLDPLVRDRLDRAFEEFGLEDPERHFRDAIARYRLDHIVDAIATFRGKRNAGTLPPDIDARYLLGIARNIAHLHEAHLITEALLDERLAASDQLLEPLRQRHQKIALAHPEHSALIRALTDQAMQADRLLERIFWLHALADAIGTRERSAQVQLFRKAAQRIHSFFCLSRHERATAERLLARRLWPLH